MSNKTEHGTMTRSVSELAEVIRGAVPAKPTADDSGALFFGIAEISAGGEGAPRFVQEGELGHGVERLAVGDVAIALMSSIGQSSLITARHAGAVLGRECAVLRPTSSTISGAWLYVWTRSPDFRRQVEQHISGSTMPRLSFRALADFTLPVPDLTRQLEVQSMLDSFDEAVSSTGRLLAQLTELRGIEVELVLAELGEGT